MKTADELVKQLPLSLSEQVRQRDFIKQIQLDAAKWGAEQVATKVRYESLSSVRIPMHLLADRLQDFATNLTIDQLPK